MPDDGAAATPIRTPCRPPDTHHPETAAAGLQGEGPGHSLLFVVYTRGYGGTERHLFELLSRLNEPRIRVTLLCLADDPYTERLSGQYIDMRPNILREDRPQSLRGWFRLFRNVRPDIATFVHGGLTTFSWQAYLGARLAGISRLFAIQHLIPPPTPPEVRGRSLSGIARRLIGYRPRHLLGVRVMGLLSRTTICVSEAIRQSLIRDYRYPADRTITIHNGVDARSFAPSESIRRTFRASFKLDPEDVLVVCTARLSHEKGIDVLLAALAGVVREHPRCKCVLLGDGPQRGELLEKVRELRLVSHVFLEGFHHDVTPYLQAADVFVLASYKEGLPFAVLEAMACGLPCVVTNVGGNAEAVSHKVHGLLVAPGSVADLSQALAHLIIHREERESMSRLARIRVSEAFNIDATMADIVRAILS